MIATVVVWVAVVLTVAFYFGFGANLHGRDDGYPDMTRPVSEAPGP